MTIRWPARTTARALLAVLGAPACSDATGPSAPTAHPLLVRRATHLPEVWEFTGRAGRRVVIDSAGPIRDLAASPDGRLAVSTAVDAGYVNAIFETTRDGRWLRTLLRGRSESSTWDAHGLAYSPDGQRLAWWVRYVRIDSLFVLDAGSATPRGIVARPAPSRQGVVRGTPSGMIAFQAGGELVTVDPATGATTTAFTGPDSIFDFDFAADGRLVVTTRAPGPAFARMLAQRTVGGPTLPVGHPTDSYREEAQWSPDGQRILTTATERVLVGGVAEPRSVPDVIDLSGERSRVQIGGARLSSFAGWTPDGRVVFLAYPPSRTLDPSWRLDVYVALPGGRATNLTDTPDAYETEVVIPP